MERRQPGNPVMPEPVPIHLSRGSWVTLANRTNVLVILGIVLLAPSCQQRSGPKTFLAGVRRGAKVVLYEGLPHHTFEKQLLENELRIKKTRELHGYPFYQAPLALATQDAQRLTSILGDSGTYKPFTGEKKCGGFHPDFSVEWHDGTDRFIALICFGCSEVKLFGPGLSSRYDLNQSAKKGLNILLQGYRKSRPASTGLGG